MRCMRGSSSCTHLVTIGLVDLQDWSSASILLQSPGTSAIHFDDSRYRTLPSTATMERGELVFALLRQLSVSTTRWANARRYALDGSAFNVREHAAPRVWQSVRPNLKLALR